MFVYEVNNKMKKQAIVYFGIFLVSLSGVLASQADELSEVAQLKAAIEAFGVPAEQAEKAAIHSVKIIEQEKKAANDKSYEDMKIVSDDFFTLSPF